MLDGNNEEIDADRRRFLETAAMTIAASRLGLIGVANTGMTNRRRESGTTREQKAHASFGPIKQVDAGLLNVGYAEEGPPDGPVVILLHGWPYDIHSYVDVAPLLAAKGYRVIVPYLRGYGTTRFLSRTTFRNGQQSAVAIDFIALMDALKINKAIIGGFDWGARTADIMAALWPERCKAIVSVSGYLITNLKANLQPLPPKAELGWWYQYYFATDRGERATTKTATISTGSYGRSFRRNGTLTMRRSIAPQSPSTTRITSHRHPQLSLAARAWPRVSRVRSTWKRNFSQVPSSPSPPSRLPAISMAPPQTGILRQKVLRQIFAPDFQGHRPQRASGSSGEVCPGHSRCRPSLIRSRPALSGD